MTAADEDAAAEFVQKSPTDRDAGPAGSGPAGSGPAGIAPAKGAPAETGHQGAEGQPIEAAAHASAAGSTLGSTGGSTEGSAGSSQGSSPASLGQLLGTLAMLAGPVALGWMGRDPLAGVPMLLAFVVIKAVTRWELWSEVIAERGSGVLPAMIAATFSVQAVVVTCLFVLGRGLSMMTGVLRPAGGLEALDLTLAGLVAAAATTLPILMGRGKQWMGPGEGSKRASELP